MLKVRERSTFWLKHIYLEDRTMISLLSAILKKYSGKGDIIFIYTLWERVKLMSDEQVLHLKHGEELEIVFENPYSVDRGSYSKWKLGT